MERGYDHADDRRWPTPRLVRRLFEVLQNLDEPYLTEQRKTDKVHEAEYISFELRSRNQDDGTEPLTIEDVQDILEEERNGE